LCSAQDVDVLKVEQTQPGSRRPLVVALGLALAVVVVDHLTKAWAVARLELGPCSANPDGCIDVALGLRFHLVHNRGAAFSTGTELGPLFGVVALAMTVVLFNMARQRADRWTPIMLGVVAGGAIGNLIDRAARADDGILSGPVIDFIDLQWWPVFNVADSAVVVGVIALVIYFFLEPDTTGD